ncbi:MAG: DUF885 domain-containing protein, partial [Acidobacteriota bacterium]
MILPGALRASAPSATEHEATERTATEALHALIEADWQYRLSIDPLLATREGVESAYDRMPDASLDAMRRATETRRRHLAELEAIDRRALSEIDKVTWDVLRWQLSEQIAEFELRHYFFPINSDSGFHTAATWIPDQQPLGSVAEVDAYIERLRALPASFDQQIGHLRAAIEAGWTQPRVVLEGYEVTIASHVVENAEDSLFYAPFERLPASIPASEHARLRAAGAEAVMAGPVVAFRNFLSFFESVYRPAARETIGISDVPGGREYYANRVRHYTTLDVDADAVHEIGLGEVARIRADMDAVIRSLRDAGEFEGSFAEFLTFLRTDPRFYAETPEELLSAPHGSRRRWTGLCRASSAICRANRTASSRCP